jgi:hypothetical protein
MFDGCIVAGLRDPCPELILEGSCSNFLAVDVFLVFHLSPSRDFLVKESPA